MKPIHILIPIILLISCRAKESQVESDLVLETETNLIKFDKILGDLDSIIINSSNKNPTIENNFKLILRKIHDRTISIKYDTALDYSFRACAAAGYVDGDTLKYTLSFGTFIPDAYDDFPSLIQAIVIHEVQHLSDFISNRSQIAVSENNPIEKTYFEIDGLYQESRFIKAYVGKATNLSPVESYILTDDNLLGSAILFEMVDLDLLHQMDDIKSKPISFAQGQKEFVEIGERLMQTIVFSKGEDGWNNYCRVIKLKTYIFYSKQVLHDLLSTLSNQSYSDSELDMKAYPKIFDVIKKLQSMLDANYKYLSYHDSLMSNFDRIIEKKMK